MTNYHTVSHALVRSPGASFAGAISSAALRIDVRLAQAQHAEYCQALAAAGLVVEALPPDERYPDSCFIQDPAVVIAGRAIVGRLGAATRQGEEQALDDYLAGRMPVARVAPPGTLEGGDVMILPRRILVGRSQRTNAAGCAQLVAALTGSGLPVESVPITGCLHLLTWATYLDDNTVLATSEAAGYPAFANLKIRVVPLEESYAANVLAIGARVVMPAGYPRVAGMLRAAGFEILPVPMSEYAKADGGVTCLSLVW